MLKLNKDLPVFFDTESICLYGKTRLAQIYQVGMEKAALLEFPDEAALQTFLNDYHIVMHNAHYDITSLQTHANNRFVFDNFDDTFLLARLAFPRLEAYSLDAVMTHVLGYDPYAKAGLDKKEMQKSDWTRKVLTEDQVRYASIDVEDLPAVYEAVKHMKESLSYKLDMLTLRYCLDFQWNGMPIDQRRVMEEKVKCIKAQKENPLPPNPNKPSEPVNCNSYVQVRKLLNTDASDDIALAKLAINGSTDAKLIRLHRKMIKRLNFLSKYSKSRLTGKFKPSARSGRLTSDDDNLQQIPRALKVIFGTKPGRVLVFADYAQLELRTIAVITRCIAMIKLFKDGQDLHDFVATMLFGENFTKEDRQVTKTCNFNFLYGGGIAVFLNILIKTVEIVMQEGQAGKLRNRWRNLFKEIAGWQERGAIDWRNGKVWSTPFGREYIGNMMTDQLNIQNQGFGAEVSKLALHYLLRDNSLANLGGVLCNFIHDSYIIECDNDPAVYMPIAEHLGKSMQTAWFEACKMTDVHYVPMPVKILVGTNWGEMEAGNYIEKIDVDGLKYMS